VGGRPAASVVMPAYRLSTGRSDIAAGETKRSRSSAAQRHSGKTTLAGMLRLIRISGGEIRFQGRDVTATIGPRTSSRLAARIPGYLVLA